MASAKLVRIDHPLRPEVREVQDVAAGTILSDLLPSGNWAVHLNGRLLSLDEFDVALSGGDIATARALPGPPVVAFFAAYGAYIALASTIISAGVSLYQQSAARRSARHARKGTGAVSSAPFYAVSGARNEIRPFGSIQQHYGRITMAPDLLIPPITTVSSDADLAVQCLFCVGKGFYSPVTLAEVKYGAQAISGFGVRDFAAYDGLTTALQPAQVLSKYFVNTIEEPLDLPLENRVNGSVAQVRTTQDNAQAFDVQIVFPQGLIRIARDGKQRPMSVRLRIRYREVGEVDWIVAREEDLVGFIPQKFAINQHVEPASTGQFEVESQLIPNAPPSYYPPDRGGDGGDASLVTGDASWLSLRSYLFGAPVIAEEAEGLTMFGLQIEASELVSGQLDQVNIETQRMLPTWDSINGWSTAIGGRDPADYTATSNPAWAYANELRDAGVPDDEIDAAQIKRWADFCDANGWECNLPYNDEITLDDSLSTIASSGQAFPTMKGSLFSVVFDELRDPVAAFGPQNSRDLVVTQAPLERVDAYQVRFSNGDANGRLDERVIYLNGHTAETAEVFRTMDVLNGLTDPILVERYVRLEDLKQRLRLNTYSFTTDWSAMVCEVGDVVVLQHHGALYGDAQVEVDSYSTKNAGAHVDEIFVHPAVRIEAGRTYSLRVRSREEGADGGYKILTYPIVNPLTAGVQKMTALEVQGNVAVPLVEGDPDTLEGQPAFLGEPDDGLVMVTEVKIQQGGSCALQAVDFAPELFDEELLETLFTPIADSTAIALAPPPMPTLAQPVYSRVQGTGNTGTVTQYGALTFFNFEYVVKLAAPQSFPPVAKYRVQFKYHLVGITTEWMRLPDAAAPASEIVIGPVSSAAPNVDIRIFPVSVTGVQGPALLLENVAPSQAINIIFEF
jgi:hypothetical protein